LNPFVSADLSKQLAGALKVQLKVVKRLSRFDTLVERDFLFLVSKRTAYYVRGDFKDQMIAVRKN
jgi:hypothetical protein